MAYKFIKKGYKKRKDFKTQDQYLDYIFKKNKEKLTTIFGNDENGVPIKNSAKREKISLERFKGTVESYKVSYDINVNKALSKLGNKVAFTPESERLRDNMVKGLKSVGAYNTFQQLNRDKKGRFTKFDSDKMKWDRNNQSYIYDNRVMISFRNSPQQTVLTDMITGISYYFDGEI